MSALPGARTRRLRFLSLAALAAGSLAAATLVAAPAQAAADPTLHGIVTYDGHPVAGVEVAIVQTGSQNTIDIATTDAHGAWSSTGSLPDGGISLTYNPISADGAPYAAIQDSTGSSEPSIAITPARTLTVSHGVPSATSFTQALKHTGSVIRIATRAVGGGAITGDAASLNPTVDFTATSSLYALLAAGGFFGTNSTLEVSQSSGAYPGYLELAHLVPGAYGYAEADIDGYEPSVVDPITTRAGATSTATVSLPVAGTPTVPLPSSDVTISGTMKVGSKLTAHAEQSTPKSTITVSWYTVNLTSAIFGNGSSFPFAPIPGATGPTFTPTVDQLGSTIVAFATYRSPGYADTINGPDYVSFIGGLIAPVAKGDPVLRSVVVSGTPTLGHTITARLGAAVVGGTTTSYRWLRDGQPIIGENGSRHTITKADYGHTLKMRVVSTAQGHRDAVLYSSPITVKDSLGLSTKVSGKKVTITVTRGVSGRAASGTVKVYFLGSHVKTVKLGGKRTFSVTLPLGKGAHRIRVVYSGSSVYKAKTATKTTHV